MKESYQKPVLDILLFEREDVITTSGIGSDTDSAISYDETPGFNLNVQ